jgi:hypothetical protein
VAEGCGEVAWYENGESAVVEWPGVRDVWVLYSTVLYDGHRVAFNRSPLDGVASAGLVRVWCTDKRSYR